MNASDIKNIDFSKSAFGGYKVEDVRDFLKEMSEHVLSLEEKLYKLDRENKNLKSKLLEAEKTQDEIKEIMISAQDFKHKILKEAEDKTNELVMQAKERARSIENDAQQQADEQVKQAAKQLESKRYQFEELKKKVSEFKVKLMELYKAHIDLITKIPEVSDLEEVDDSKNTNNLLESEDESEAFENLQKFNLKNEEKLSVGSSIQRNLSGNENIFKKNVSGNFERNVFTRMSGKGDNYIKSRFEELDR